MDGRRMAARVFHAVACLAVFLPSFAIAQDHSAGTLRVGAAKVDITPAPQDLPDHYRGVLDPVFSRAIVVDNGATQVALVTVDALSLSGAVVERLGERIAAETGIPVAQLLIAGTGTHSVPTAMTDADAPSPSALLWERRIVESVERARDRLRPATVTYGSGLSYINVQRDRIDPVTRRWWEGPDYAGVSDKRVGVMSFRDVEGEPIAAYYNYGVFNVVTGMLDLVSGDVTGAASAYIEDAVGEDFVAALALAAHGDQNPVFFNQTFALRDLRIRDYAARGQDIALAMPPPGGQGLDRADPTVARLMDQQRRVNAALGLMLGEEVLHVLRESPPGASTAAIYTDQRVVSCPGRVRTNQGRGGVAGVYADAAPVEIRLGLVLIGDIAIGAVSGAPYAAIGARLKAESPFARTMLVTRANGYSAGYIPDDAAYGHETFAVLNARLKPGCAEDAIVDGILGMMPPSRY